MDGIERNLLTKNKDRSDKYRAGIENLLGAPDSSQREVRRKFGTQPLGRMFWGRDVFMGLTLFRADMA